jgi:hypothetical protein
MVAITQPVRRLVDAYQKHLADKRDYGNEPVISVDEIATKVATFYERVRNLIDYHEAHLLRKRVIGRALKRRIFLKNINGKDVAEPLIKEVIRSGYLRNNAIVELKIGEVQKVIDSVLFTMDHLKGVGVRNEELFQWFLGVAVCVIEETLVPPTREKMLADCMFSSMRERIEFRDGEITDADRDTLLFIAVQRSLLRVDEDQLHCRLLDSLYPNWTEFSNTELAEFAGTLPIVRERITSYSKHKLLPLFLLCCNKYAFLFRIIGDIVFGGKGFEELQGEVSIAYKERYTKKKQQLFRLAFFSVISFFLSKVLIAFAIEYPIDSYILGHFSFAHTIINILVPPFLMLLIVAVVNMPSEQNVKLVTTEIESLVYGDPVHTYAINIPKKQHWFLRFFVQFSYFAVFSVSLYYIVLFLTALGFSIANVVVFVLFTSLIAATGVRIYNRSREISLEEKRQGLLIFLIDLFTLPLVTMGRWFMSGLQRFNVLVLFLDFFIELPFQLFVEFLENFNGFLRRKKDEVM